MAGAGTLAEGTLMPWGGDARCEDLRKTELRPVRYVRVDLPADGSRCTGYLSQTDRWLRVGSRVTGVPGWGSVAVVDDPVTRHGVEHVPVAAPGWARTTDRGATR